MPNPRLRITTFRQKVIQKIHQQVPLRLRLGAFELYQMDNLLSKDFYPLEQQTAMIETTLEAFIRSEQTNHLTPSIIKLLTKAEIDKYWARLRPEMHRQLASTYQLTTSQYEDLLQQEASNTDKVFSVNQQHVADLIRTFPNRDETFYDAWKKYPSISILLWLNTQTNEIQDRAFIRSLKLPSVISTTTDCWLQPLLAEGIIKHGGPEQRRKLRTYYVTSAEIANRYPGQVRAAKQEQITYNSKASSQTSEGQPKLLPLPPETRYQWENEMQEEETSWGEFLQKETKAVLAEARVNPADPLHEWVHTYHYPRHAAAGLRLYLQYLQYEPNEETFMHGYEIFKQIITPAEHDEYLTYFLANRHYGKKIFELTNARKIPINTSNELILLELAQQGLFERMEEDDQYDLVATGYLPDELIPEIDLETLLTYTH